MPGPPRRLKVILLLVLLIVLISFYITTSAHTTRTSPFYTRTQDALAAQRAAKEESLGHTDNSATDRSSEKSDLQDTPIDAKPGSVGGDEIRKGLKEAEEAAKAAADRKGDEFHGESGRERAAQVQAAMKEKDEEKKKVEPETEEQSRVKEELNAILKRSPGEFDSESQTRADGPFAVFRRWLDKRSPFALLICGFLLTGALLLLVPIPFPAL